MAQNASGPENLVMTQAEVAPPPDVTVPDPPPERRANGGAGQLDPDTLRDLKRLAERVGGLEKLREVIDVLMGVKP